MDLVVRGRFGGVPFHPGGWAPFPPALPAFRNFMKRCPVRRIRFHDLRETHASLLAKAGVPIGVISKRLGHSDISITYDRYITVYRDRDVDAAEAFARIVT